jgi:hypothetical protein
MAFFVTSVIPTSACILADLLYTINIQKHLYIRNELVQFQNKAGSLPSPKTADVTFAASVDLDLPALAHSLIRVYTVCYSVKNFCTIPIMIMMRWSLQ